MASTSISGWSGAGDRKMTLTATVSNASDTSSTLTMAVSITGGDSNYYDSHIHIYTVDRDTNTTYEIYEDSSAYSEHKWYAGKGGSNTFTQNWTRAKSVRNVRVYIVGYAYTYSDKSNYVDVTIPVKTSYTVTYNANNGSGAPASQTKWYGENITLSSTKPTRTGYTFSKWNTKADGSGTNYNAGATYSANAAATLYAQWTINTYTVSYNANGGSNAPASQTKTYGVALTLQGGSSSTRPTRTDYTFMGWATSASGSVAYAGGASYTTNAAATLYAVWEAIAPTVTQSVTIASSTKLNLSATANANCNLWRYKLDGGSWTTFSSTDGTSATGTVTVSAGSHTIQIAARRTSNSTYGYGTAQTLDTSLPTISFVASNIQTNSFTIDITTNVTCNQWWYSTDGGTTWKQISTTSASSCTYNVTTVSGSSDALDVNTTYSVKVKAKKASNNLTNTSSAQSISTQGGIAHIKIGNVWKDAIVYVKVGSTWKQALCYTKVGNSWRINT